MSNAAEPRAGCFESHPPHEPVDLVAEVQKIVSQIAAVLTRDPGNQRFLRHNRVLMCLFVAKKRTLPESVPACEAVGFCLKWPFFIAWPSCSAPREHLICSDLRLYCGGIREASFLVLVRLHRARASWGLACLRCGPNIKPNARPIHHPAYFNSSRF